jgi:NAD(P)-dependent dehydrogenase (short-subunit alcohol dehydrogenase family)
MTSALQNRVALITGAASGIGLRMAEVYGEAGARLVLADKNPAIVEIATRLGGTGLVVDLTSPEEAERMVAETLAKAGRLDILVNNAGMDGEQAPTGRQWWIST